jgi:hypothetical protein
LFTSVQPDQVVALLEQELVSQERTDG